MMCYDVSFQEPPYLTLCYDVLCCVLTGAPYLTLCYDVLCHVLTGAPLPDAVL